MSPPLQADPEAPWLRRLVERRWRLVTILLFIYAEVIVFWARVSVFGADAVSRWSHSGRLDLQGYPSRAWIVWRLALPAAWLLYCLLLNRTIGFAQTQGRPAQRAISTPVAGDLEGFVRSFRNSCYRGLALWIPLVVTVALSGIDITPVARMYVDGVSTNPGTWARDWSIYSIAKATDAPSEWLNWCFNVAAYLQQWIASFLALHLVGVVVMHSLSFLRAIECGGRSRSSISIRADVLDPQGFLGFGDARWLFNWQMGLGLVSGVFALVSRFANTEAARAAALEELKGDVDPFKASVWVIQEALDHARDFFPSIGQTVLTLAWLVVVASAFLPALVKYLPFVRGVTHHSDCEYVKAFATSTGEPCSALVRGFAEQNYWPAGDFWALLLIGVNTFIGLNLIVPAFHGGELLSTSVIVEIAVAVISAAIAGAAWAAFRFGLGLWYPTLVRT